jgi:hypothetical protein
MRQIINDDLTSIYNNKLGVVSALWVWALRRDLAQGLFQRFLTRTLPTTLGRFLLIALSVRDTHPWCIGYKLQLQFATVILEIGSHLLT